jgi:mitochondrial import receptor subunit TOM20
MVTALDADLIGTGTYCSYCLRATQPSASIHVPLDPFQSTYCSEECQHAAEEQYQSLLFSRLKLATPANPKPTQTKAQVEERRKAQEEFAAYIKKHGKTASLLILRFVGQLIADEHHRLLFGSDSRHELPQVPKESKLAYSFYDYVERLKGIEIVPGVSEEAEVKHCRGLLKLALEGLEEFLNDEKYLTLKGKVAYNAFGVTYGTGRTTRVSRYVSDTTQTDQAKASTKGRARVI